MDEMNNFYVQKRSMDKEVCPGYYDLMLGGTRKLSDASDENTIENSLI